MILAVAVAVASSWPRWSVSSPARKAIDPPRCTTRPVPVIRPGTAGRRKLTFSSSVGANSPSLSVATRAGPSVSSSIAARKPPCTLPIGLAKPTWASKLTSISPRSGATHDSCQPSRAAAGGAGDRPARKSQNGPVLAVAGWAAAGWSVMRPASQMATTLTATTSLVGSRGAQATGRRRGGRTVGEGDRGFGLDAPGVGQQDVAVDLPHLVAAEREVLAGAWPGRRDEDLTGTGLGDYGQRVKAGPRRLASR